MRTMPLHGTNTLSALRPPSRVSARRRLITGCAIVGFATALTAPLLKLRGQAKQAVDKRIGMLKQRRRFLHPFFVDAFIGAIGEIGQLAVLYPLDTIKVRCQAQGASTRTVWAGVKSQGFNRANLKSLFAGCAPSAMCAALIGACYLASFCTAKRVFAKATVVASHTISEIVSDQAQPQAPSRRYSDNRGAADHDARRRQATGTSLLAVFMFLPGCSSMERVVRGADESVLLLQSREASSSGRLSDESQAQDSAANDTAAALVASLLTSVLEAPVELFRHRMQAGLSQGKMLSNMASALGGEGLASLYWGYAPFLLKGIPYDVAELFSYSQLTKGQERIPLLSSLPVACRDCFIGAMAGGAAVLFSMPADCVKTRLELGSARPPSGLINGSVTFFTTGRQMLAESGLRSMFVGLTPRLLENVPSTMFYWVLVAALRRTLEPFTIRDEAPQDASVA